MNPNGGGGIERAPAGEAVVARVGDPGQVVFQVRETSSVIKYLGETRVEVRAGLFAVRKVVVVAVLLRAGQYVKREYATWWDYCRPESPSQFEAMSRQEHLSFSFYGDSCSLERTFIAMNSLKPFFAEAISRLAPLPPWSAEEFRAARMEVENQPLPLWERVREGEG